MFAASALLYYEQMGASYQCGRGESLLLASFLESSEPAISHSALLNYMWTVICSPNKQPRLAASLVLRMLCSAPYCPTTISTEGGMFCIYLSSMNSHSIGLGPLRKPSSRYHAGHCQDHAEVY